MPSKPVNPRGRPIIFCFLALATVAPGAFAAENSVPAAPRFVGMQSCGSAGCHGGAGEMRRQVDLWTRLDFHSKSAHTLTSARSEQIARAAGIADATQSARCTTCHAPFHEVPAKLFATEIKPSVGVSCENCHGPAERWLLSHTRKDFSHAEKVTAGLRDLRDLTVRANACVACHQTVETPLTTAGHPELIFELDGQSVTQPRHWKERGHYHGGQAWLVGQATALREMSWQLSGEPANAALAARWSALVWLVQKIDGVDSALPSPKTLVTVASADNAKRAQQFADTLATESVKLEWSAELSLKLLQKLAATHPEFREPAATPLLHARRAERLVLALDRLVTSLERAGLDRELKELFTLAQSVPDFDSAKFADALEKFARSAGGAASSANR